MPLRVMPREGAEVTVIDLDARMAGVITEVREGGRRVLVLTDDGQSLEFVLRGATAVYTLSPESAWPRLRLGD